MKGSCLFQAAPPDLPVSPRQSVTVALWGVILGSPPVRGDSFKVSDPGQQGLPCAASMLLRRAFPAQCAWP